jgi:lipopolysaccharide transport system ATP-binding protein
MSSNISIRVNNLSKRYEIYEKPIDRLKQLTLPKIHRFLGSKQKKYFRDFWALKDVSFEVDRGQTLGIIGRNGSGKSTLLQILCGVLSPTHGEVSINGKVAALLELGSGFNPEFTGRENVYLNASLYGLSQEQIEDRIDNIFAFADIGDFVDQPVKIYSSGMMVRLAFAVIAHVDADILVVDEALAVGDVFFVQKCMRFIRQFAEENTLLFVTHDTSSVVALCSDAIILDSGSVRFKGSPKEAIKKYTKMQYASLQNIERAISDQRIENQDPPSLSTIAINPSPQGDCREEVLEKYDLISRLTTVSKTLKEDFGDNSATITSVKFLDDRDQAIASITGYCRIKLLISAKVHSYIVSPIIGFELVNRHGIPLISDNTFLSSLEKPVVEAFPEQELQATFEFQMPSLRAGDYSLHVAIASGTQADHQQHHYIHDAVVFKSSPSFTVHGECNPPLIQCTLEVIGCHDNH